MGSLTDRQIEELRLRMHKHAVVGDVAVVVLTAAELGGLLDEVTGLRRLLASERARDGSEPEGI